MGLFNLFSAGPQIDYDAIDPVTVQTNLLMMTESEDRQKTIKKMRVGSLVTLSKTKRNGQTIYVVSDLNSGNVIGEISYGTSDYLAANYPTNKMLGKVTEIGHISPNGRGTQVKIEYKVYL